MAGIYGGRLVAFCCALVFAASALAQSADEIREGKVCANCHAGAVNIWGGKHGTKADSRTPMAIVGCATCHGDPTEHVKSPATPMPRRFSKMTSVEKNDACLTCHQGGKRIHWPAARTSARRHLHVVPTVHSAHDRTRDKLTQSGNLLPVPQGAARADQPPSRHPIREGLVACSDCHNAHGSAGRA